MAILYNEVEKFPVAWLRELIRAGELPEGDIADFSICDLGPADVIEYTQFHTFAGIGGWPHVLRNIGWPDDVPVWTGSCPCQPFSVAGKGKGTKDERHLWPFWRNLIEDCRPPIVFGEQVASKAGRAWFGAVSSEMEALGYSVAGADLCAASVGAPHIRQRLLFVAYAGGQRCERLEVFLREWAARSHLLEAPGGCGTRGVGDALHKGLEGRQGVQVPDQGAARAAGLARGVGDPDEDRSGREPRGDDCAQEEGRKDGRDGYGAQSSSKACRVADAHGRNPREEREQRGRKHRQFEEDGSSCDVADTLSAGRAEGWAGAGEGSLTGGGCVGAPTSGFWADAEWIYCKDEKYRAVEPGTFPLAHGIPGRMGKLRGYGNAIVPEATALFVASALDSIAETFFS